MISFCAKARSPFKQRWSHRLLWFTLSLNPSSAIIADDTNTSQLLDHRQAVAALDKTLKRYSPTQLLLSPLESPKPPKPLVTLGRELFFSKSLSGSFDVACASCHHPLLSGGDGLSLPVGIEARDPDLLGRGRSHDWQTSLDPKANGAPNVSRHSPTTFNSRFYQKSLFNDGRVFVMEKSIASNKHLSFRTPDSNLWSADTIQENSLLAVQTRFPVVAIEEMLGYQFAIGKDNDGIRQELTHRLQTLAGDGKPGSWLYLFRQAFPTNENAIQQTASDIINFDHIQKAIGAYQESQILINNPWQRYLQGDRQTLSIEAIRGAELFFTSAQDGGAGCADCHQPPFFTDEQFHILAVPQFGRGKNADGSDYGRFAVNRRPEDRFKFRTPSLLNVAETAPYGHTGAFQTLQEIVHHHLNPSESFENFDFKFSNNPQLRQWQRYSTNAKDLSRTALNQLIQAQQNNTSQLPVIGELSERFIPDIVAFLSSLTDPCIVDQGCLTQWLPDYQKPAPDEHRLQAIFQTEVDNIDHASISIIEPPTYDSPNLKYREVNAQLLRDPCYNNQNQAPPAAATGLANNNVDIVFEEVSLQVGLHYNSTVDWSAYNLRNAQRLLFSGGVAAGDVNGDCLPDIFLPDGNRSIGQLYLNEGIAGFENATQEWGLSAISISPSAFSNGAALADIDGDSDLDILVSQLASGKSTNQDLPDTRPKLLINNGRYFSEAKAIGFHPQATSWSFAISDYDLDNDLDIFTTHWRGPGVGGAHPNHLWRNDMSPTRLIFSPVDKEVGLADLIGQTDFTFTGTFTDISQDGLPDLLVAADFESSQWYVNTGGRFKRRTNKHHINDENGMGSAVGDYDNDGDMDWFVSSVWDPNGKAEGNWGVSGNRLYINDSDDFINSTEPSQLAQGYWGWGACFADFNNDQRLDLFHTTGFDLPHSLAKQFGHPAAFIKLKNSLREFQNTPNMLFMANPTGGFTEQSHQAGITDINSGRGVVCFDFDLDGDVDILVANHNAPPSLYRNLTRQRSDHHFLKVRLQHPNNANYFGIGARITARLGTVLLTREIRSGGGFLSGGPPLAHFGLGSAKSIDELTVYWPDGGRSQFVNLDANHTITVLRE